MNGGAGDADLYLVLLPFYRQLFNGFIQRHYPQ